MSILPLKALSDVIDKLKAAAAPDMARIQADTMAYGQAFYRVREDGSFCHVPAADVLADPEVPVTDEMNAAGEEARGLHGAGVFAFNVTESEAVYRAMAAVAPKDGVEWVTTATLDKLQDRIAELEAENATLLATVERADACIGKLMVELAAAETDRDSWKAGAIYGERRLNEFGGYLQDKDATIARLKSELAAMRIAPTTKPTDTQLTPGDASATAPLERRADGTLKPVAKAWEAPKQASDPRRIGA